MLCHMSYVIEYYILHITFYILHNICYILHFYYMFHITYTFSFCINAWHITLDNTIYIRRPLIFYILQIMKYLNTGRWTNEARNIEYFFICAERSDSQDKFNFVQKSFIAGPQMQKHYVLSLQYKLIACVSSRVRSKSDESGGFRQAPPSKCLKAWLFS